MQVPARAAAEPEPGAHGDPFGAFWMVGYEGADHRNRHGVALDMPRATGHDAHLDEDYAAAAALGFGVARESVSWRTAETANGYDFTRALAPWSDAPVYNPINEISFLCYAVCDTTWIHP